MCEKTQRNSGARAVMERPRSTELASTGPARISAPTPVAGSLPSMSRKDRKRAAHEARKVEAAAGSPAVPDPRVEEAFVEEGKSRGDLGGATIQTPRPSSPPLAPASKSKIVDVPRPEEKRPAAPQPDARTTTPPPAQIRAQEQRPATRPVPPRQPEQRSQRPATPPAAPTQTAPAPKPPRIAPHPTVEEHKPLKPEVFTLLAQARAEESQKWRACGGDTDKGKRRARQREILAELYELIEEATSQPHFFEGDNRQMTLSHLRNKVLRDAGANSLPNFMKSV